MDEAVTASRLISGFIDTKKIIHTIIVVPHILSGHFFYENFCWFWWDRGNWRYSLLIYSVFYAFFLGNWNRDSDFLFVPPIKYNLKVIVLIHTYSCVGQIWFLFYGAHEILNTRLLVLMFIVISKILSTCFVFLSIDYRQNKNLAKLWYCSSRRSTTGCLKFSWSILTKYSFHFGYNRHFKS